MMSVIRSEWEECRSLLRNIPSMVLTIFILSVVCMNLMAGRELYRSAYFCINSGLALSWISFLCMDCICKRFGAKAAATITVIAMFVNVATAVIFRVLCMAPGRWAAYYSAPDAVTGELIHMGLDSTFSSTWYVVFGSAAAMLVSGIANSLLNVSIGKIADRGDYKGFAARSLISSCIAQWIDNFVFSALVSHVFFGWNWTQVLICSTTSMLIEVLAEAVFSPVGYRVSRGWEADKVGQNYLDLVRRTKLQTE